MFVRFCKLTKWFKKKKAVILVVFNSLFCFCFTRKKYIKLLQKLLICKNFTKYLYVKLITPFHSLSSITLGTYVFSDLNRTVLLT